LFANPESFITLSTELCYSQLSQPSSCDAKNCLNCSRCQNTEIWTLL